MFGRKRRQRSAEQLVAHEVWVARQQWLERKIERESDARLAELWEWAGRFTGNQPGHDRQTCFGFVESIHQRARRGTKAYVEWWPDRRVIATWFQDGWPDAGHYVVATGNLGFGTHQDDTVFYVEAQGFEVVPGSAGAAHERHRLRAIGLLDGDADDEEPPLPPEQVPAPPPDIQRALRRRRWR